MLGPADKRGWLWGLLAALIAALAAGIFRETARDMLAFVGNAASAVYRAVGAFLATRFPVWGFLATALVLASLVWLFRVFRSTASAYQLYSSDVFEGVRWRWQWPLFPTSIHPFCPDCDILLVPQKKSDYHNGVTTLIHCDRCGKEIAVLPGELFDFQVRLAREIDRNVRTGDWVERVSK